MNQICTDRKGADKLIHFLVVLLVTMLTGVIALQQFGFRLPPALLVALVVAVAVSVGRELYDRRKPGGHFCVWDLLWDAIGTVAALFLLCLYRLLLC